MKLSFRVKYFGLSVMYKFLLGLTILLLFSCSSEKPAGVEVQKPSSAGERSIPQTSQTGIAATSGSYSLEIVPVNVTGSSTIYLIPHGFDFSEAKIEWFVNGIPVKTPVPGQFKTDSVKKNDRVQARATIRGKEMSSNVIQVRNSPPELSSVKILPEIFKPGETLYVEASGSDKDGDGVTILYEWKKNGEVVSTSKQIGVPLKRGDKVDVKLTPFDGEAYGRPVILHREITNSPPVISEDKNYNFDGNIFTSQVKATDPDGDALAYSLKSAPPGMTINSSTGLIKWNVPLNFQGRAPFTVSVTDGHGGEASQSLTVDIKAEQKKQKN